MSEENVERIRQAQAAFSGGDLSVAKELVAEDVEWGSLGSWPGNEPVYRGPDAMDRWMETIRSAWETFEVSTGEVLRDEGDVVVISERLRGRGQGSGVEVEMEVFGTCGKGNDTGKCEVEKSI
jgi:ketosteroid isomerase-like protein